MTRLSITTYWRFGDPEHCDRCSGRPTCCFALRQPRDSSRPPRLTRFSCRPGQSPNDTLCPAGAGPTRGPAEASAPERGCCAPCPPPSSMLRWEARGGRCGAKDAGRLPGLRQTHSSRAATDVRPRQPLLRPLGRLPHTLTRKTEDDDGAGQHGVCPRLLWPCHP